MAAGDMAECIWPSRLYAKHGGLDSLAGAAGYVPASSAPTTGGGNATAVVTNPAASSPGVANGVTVAQTTSVNVVVPQGPVTNGGVINGVVVNGGVPVVAGQPPRPVVVTNVPGRPPVGPLQMVAAPMAVPGGGGPTPSP